MEEGLVKNQQFLVFGFKRSLGQHGCIKKIGVLHIWLKFKFLSYISSLNDVYNSWGHFLVLDFH